MISSILLVPAEGDPLGLLDPGWCGARVPQAFRDVRAPPGWSMQPAPEWHIDGVSPTYERALVLAYRGEVVPEGVDRAKRVLTNANTVGGWWWPNTPTRIRKWLSGDRTAAYLIHPETPVRVVLLGDDDRPLDLAP